MATYVENILMETHCCGACGITFAAPESFWNQKRKDRTGWSCPNGHQRVFTGKTEEQKLREELENKEQTLIHARQRADRAEQNLGRVTRAHGRMRQRVKNGVCPCCTRSFENLRRHMQTEHPDFGTGESLRALREAFGMTQADVAKEAGVHTPQVSLYERQKSVPQYVADALAAWADSQAGTRDEQGA